MTINLFSKQYNERNDFNVNSRNIGEIVISTIPLNDASLHLLDGSIIHGSGVYEAFFQHMAKLYENNPQIFCTEEEYQQSIIKFDVCPKYVYDGETNTIRLPKIIGHIEGTLDFNKLGTVLEAGIPNAIGSIPQVMIGEGTAKGACKVFGGNPGTATKGANHWKSLEINPSIVSHVYKDNFDTVQTQSSLVYYYVVIATAVKTNLEVNIDNVMNELNCKADISLENAKPEQSFRDKSVVWGMPDYSSAISISALGSINAYTAPTSGFVSIQQSSRGIAAGQCKINGIIVLYFDNTNNGYVTTRSLVPIKKGDNVYWEVISDGLGIGIEGWFIPANL